VRASQDPCREVLEYLKVLYNTAAPGRGNKFRDLKARAEGQLAITKNPYRRAEGRESVQKDR